MDRFIWVQVGGLLIMGALVHVLLAVRYRLYSPYRRYVIALTTDGATLAYITALALTVRQWWVAVVFVLWVLATYTDLVGMRDALICERAFRRPSYPPPPRRTPKG